MEPLITDHQTINIYQRLQNQLKEIKPQRRSQ